MERKKPAGKEYEQFCLNWDIACHDDKVSLAESYEATYETARHWRSDGDTTPKFEPEITAEDIKDMLPKCEDLPGVKELKEMWTIHGAGTNLNFVCFDLETTNFKADFSIILCACIKPFGQKPIVFRSDEANDGWDVSRSNDWAITYLIAEELRKHAVVVTHYGSKFDMPYLRAKMVHHKMPPLPPMFGMDTYAVAKQNFLISSRRLENLARYFEIGKGKHGVVGDLWMRAGVDGDKKALDEIVKHNIVDCELLEQLAMLSFPYLRSIKRL